MQLQQISHNEDISRLIADGYDLGVCDNYLVISRIPYVTANRTVVMGTLVCALSMMGPTKVGTPPDHTIYFIGETPHNANGTPITAIINNSQNQQLTVQLSINHYFSSKPSAGNYPNYYEKIRTYSEILTAQARIIDPTVSSRPNKP